MAETFLRAMHIASHYPRQGARAPQQKSTANLRVSTLTHEASVAKILDAKFQAQGRNFPRHAMRIASRILADLHAHPEKRAQNTWGRVRHLILTGFEGGGALEWEKDLSSIRNAFCGEGGPEQEEDVCDCKLFDALFTKDWYVSGGLCPI